MDAVRVGVSIAIEAYRRGLLDDDGLAAVLAYYDGEGARAPAPPNEVLGRFGRVPQSRALDLIEDMDLPTGQRRFNDRLTIHDTLGRGGMGVVYKAYDRLLKRVVALKVLDLRLVGSDRRATLLRRFEREAHVMARLRHSAIAQVYDAGLDQAGNPYLAMELVPGRSLEAVIEASSPVVLDVRRVVRWGATLAEALHACHVAGVVHRDVKPSNVIVTPDDDVRLIDFGVAVDELAATRLTAENARVGTVLYMAPEQARGQPCDARSDVYALAGTLFHALTGKPPINAANVILLLDALFNGTPGGLRSIRPDAPQALEELLVRCLAKAPEERPPDAATMARLLRGTLANRVRRSRSTPLTLVASAAAVAAFGAAFAGGRAKSSPVEAPTARPTSDGAPAHAAPERPVTHRGRGGPDRLPPGLEPGPGEGEYTNGVDGSTLVFVAPGTFSMGHPPDPASGVEVLWSDQPTHLVTLSGYFIGKYEVTWGQYRRFVAANPSAAPPPDADVIPAGAVPGLGAYRAADDDPAFGMTWDQARAYCAWAGLRLPTEAEWELAARGARAAWVYPWGADEPTPGRANTHGAGDGYPFVSPVGSFPAGVSPSGCHDMAGNVAEWVQDLLGPYADAPVTDPRGPTTSSWWAMRSGWRALAAGEGPLRVIRGGGWTTRDGKLPELRYYKSTRRYPGRQDQGNKTVGFRVCRSVE